MPNIRILLVEDEAPKRIHIERFLTNFSQAIQVNSVYSVNTALDRLDIEIPDILLIDMSLPTFDIGEHEGGGRPQGLGGVEILRYMSMAEIVCPVIVITGYEAFPRDAGSPVELSQIRQELLSDFSHLVRGVLHYNSTYDEWKLQLSEALSELGFIRSCK